MDTALRTRFDAGMRRVTGDPYGAGSSPVGKDEDRRQAVVADVVIRYYVGKDILMVTVVRAVYL
ncbi:hypothetical protein ACWGDX_29735 [Streptomyces sp. NPDC055025]